MKKKNQKTGLEMMIAEYLRLSQAVYEPNKAQLEIVAKNWEESKKYIRDFFKQEAYFSPGFSKRLRKEFGVGFSKKEIRSLYDESISPDAGELEIRDLIALAYSAKEIGVALTESQIKKTWTNFFSGNWKEFHLEGMIRHLGNPKLSQEELNFICNDFLRDLAGEKPIKKGKKEIIRDQTQSKDLISLLDIVSLSPQWDKELAKRAYDNRIPFLTNQFAKRDFILLRDRIGVSPPIEKVKELYRELFSKDRGNDYLSYEEAGKIAKDFESVFENTGVQLEKEDKSLMLNFYRKHLDYRNLNDIRKIEKLAGIPCPPIIFNLVYTDRLQEGDIESINLLKNKSDVEPDLSETTVQRAYKTLFKKGEVDKALRIYLFTDIEPQTDDKTINQAYKKLEHSLASKKALHYTGDFQTLRWLRERFPEQSANFAKQQIKRLCKEKEFRKAEELTSVLNTCPNPEEAYVLACRKGDWKSAKSLFEKSKEIIVKTYPKYAELSKYI